ncbi:peptidase M28-like protein [Novosphingobium sp. GV055]|nr:peptidase M28-like protein [Novosphingobium sp. GV055]PUB04685.1 peptidase M28-like protein [Novosphingobium sp. GV061]PUB21004.1 peptidase M28-like protein [Novosphingobium sp. GV079]PUB42730.1 peptidase M28-like protein [Novosphingobium sp. GV027]
MSRGARLLRALALVSLAALLPAGAAHSATVPVGQTLEQRLRAHVETLASPAFAGRRPGTEGETQTLRYLVRQWFEMGLESGTNLPGSPWFAPVELVAREPVLSRAAFMRGRRRLAADEHDVFVVTSGVRNLVESAPVLFVGHGVVPSRTELAGRVALLLESKAAAGGKRGDHDERHGDVEAGREAVGRLLDGGAMAVITVLDGTRTLDDVATRRRKAGTVLAGERLDNEIEAFVTPDMADRLLGGSTAAPGQALAAAQAEAEKPDFTPRLIGTTASLEATSTETRVRTHNLIGRIPGRDPAAGAVLLVAHWDHFGVCTAAGAICPGAVDNASGVAVITEVARQILAGMPQRMPDRDIYVLATTGEEMGLLGALAFAENPPLPLGRIVAAFNVDSTGLVPAGGQVAIVGRGMTPLDDTVARVLGRMRRKLVDGRAANAYVRRQDSWVLMQHDVPAIMVSTSYADEARLDRFMTGAYHTPADTPDHVNYAGMADDVQINTELVREFADARRYATGGVTPPATAPAPGPTNSARTP